MLIAGWIKNMISAILPEQIGQGAQAFEKKVKKKLLDVTEDIPFAEELQKKSGELLSKVNKPGSPFDRFRFRLSARRKVKQNLEECYNDVPDLMEEITEKIIEVSREDPRYRRLFS